MDLINTSIAISAGINLMMGILVLFKGKRKIINQIFSLFALSVVTWSISMMLYRSAATVGDSIFWCKTLYVSPIFIVSFLICFAYLFPESSDKIKKYIYVIVFGSGISLSGLVLFTDMIIKSVEFAPGQEKKIIFGSLYYSIYTLFISGYFLWLYYILFRKLRRSSGIVRQQIIYIFSGILLGSIAGMLTNLTLPTLGNFSLNWAGQISSLVMVLLTSYAIVRLHLMDIRFVLRRYSVYLASLITILIPAIFLKYLLSLSFGRQSILIDFVVLVLSISIFSSVKDYYYRIANKYFFSSLYDAREVIADLSEKLKATLEVKMIYAFVSGTLVNVLHIKTMTVLIWNEKTREYEAAFDTGHERKERYSFTEEPGFYTEVIKHNRVIITDESKEKFGERYGRTIALLKKYDIHVLVPLLVKDKTIGLLALGPKESGDMYNHEDVQVLEIVGAQTAIALENALLYKETKDFNVTLEKEVKRATAELKAANVKLKELDAAKSEFISIASHQLRTPLSIIKGYISMMIEGNFGRLTDKKRDALEKVFLSNERLIRLVENLLNISRIESGKLQYDFEEMRLDELVRDVMDELSGTATGKGLSIDAELPAEALPPVGADEEKLRQVVMNLIDNAIKYTTKGRIAVSLKRAGDEIEFCVSDSGMGIRPEDLPNLFKKFSRGAGTSLVHTEGTGLGLFVAKKVIDAHSGKIWAESKGAGRGAKFCFKLPILKN